jgi:hypothetical protein
MLVVLAVPVSFWPTWASVWTDRSRERSPAWGLWTFGDLATLLVLTVRGADQLGRRRAWLCRWSSSSAMPACGS